jgi:AcrR family transcriptional regulator
VDITGLGGAVVTGGYEAGGVRQRGARLPRRERRAQLLSSALEVFVQQGYHAAAMDDIAERAGVSKPVLYQHFPSKLELYLALLDTHCDAMVSKTRAAMAATPDNKQRVHSAMEAYFDIIDHESEAFRLVFESDLRNEPAARERVERAERESIEAIADAAEVALPVVHRGERERQQAAAGSRADLARCWTREER